MSERNRHAGLTWSGVEFALRQRRMTAQLASSALCRLRRVTGSAATGTLGFLATAPSYTQLDAVADAQTLIVRALPARSIAAAEAHHPRRDRHLHG